MRKIWFFQTYACPFESLALSLEYANFKENCYLLNWDGIEPKNPDIISEDCYSPSLVTLAPLNNDCTVAVAPEENEVSSSTSHMDVSIQSIMPLPRHEQRGAGRKRKSQKSEIMTSSPKIT
ncbi:hypothetical protein AVEN_50540-1 [Araneus ventricosus]|uniref:Uncharacterized protein n=1 Tax=Araneus ventricosus TaxID=182803 RepID=A0A4Y2ARZ0_ARAVE|nr:hypothetical protein AVEN_50540-1 [Araneus ventricosus]